MKIKLVVFFIIAIVSSYFIIGTPVLEISSEVVQPQETVIGKIYTDGIFLDSLKREDIRFYEGRKEVFFEYELYYYNNAYYFYVVFNREGEFTIRTKEILFRLLDEVGSKIIEKNLSVRYDNLDDSTQLPLNLLTIKPGVVFTLSNKSSIQLFNRGINDLTINLLDERSFVVNSLQAKSINLELVEPFGFVDISTYKSFRIPVIYAGAVKIKPIEINDSLYFSDLVLEPEFLEIFGKSEKIIEKEIELFNSGNKTITGFKILNNVSFADFEIPEKIEPYDVGYIVVSVYSEVSSYESGEVILNYYEGELSFNKTIPIEIIIEKTEEIPVDDNKSCAFLGGEICDGVCEGESLFAIDGYCCFGVCVPFSEIEETDDEDSFAWGVLIGLLIFFILGILGYFVYKKYHSTKPDEPNKKIDLAKKRYENRLKGSVMRH